MAQMPPRRPTRIGRALTSIAAAGVLVAGGLTYTAVETPAPVAAEPCIPGSAPTCGPGPGTGPTTDTPTGPATTAPQAPTTTVPPAQQTEAPSQPTPNQGSGGMNVQTPNQPTTNPNGIFGQTPTPQAPVTPVSPAPAPQQGSSGSSNTPGEQPSTGTSQEQTGSQQQKCELALRQLGVANSVGSGWEAVQPSDPDPALVAVICDGCNVKIKGPDYGKKNKDTFQCPSGSHADEDSDSGINPWDEDDCVANYDAEITRIVRKACEVKLGTPAIDWTQGPHKIKRGVKVATSMSIENAQSLSVALGASESITGSLGAKGKGVEIGGELTQQIEQQVSQAVTKTSSVEESLESELDVPAGETWGTFPVTCTYDVSVKSKPANGFSGPEKTTVISFKGNPGTTWVGKANRGGGYAGPAGVSGGRG